MNRAHFIYALSVDIMIISHAAVNIQYTSI